MHKASQGTSSRVEFIVSFFAPMNPSTGWVIQATPNYWSNEIQVGPGEFLWNNKGIASEPNVPLKMIKVSPYGSI